jgi:hypothetical protein
MNVTFSDTSITIDEGSLSSLIKFFYILDSQYTLKTNGMMMQYICMLHFKEDILWSGTDSSYTNTPCMPQKPIIADDQECWIAGWGSTAVIGIPSDELRSRGVRLENGTDCQDQFIYKNGACIEGEWSNAGEIYHEAPSCSNDIGLLEKSDVIWIMIFRRTGNLPS